MKTPKRYRQARAFVVLATGYVAGVIAYPYLPGPFLEQRPSARILVAFTLPTTALVIYSLFRSLWRHDRVRSGNGAFGPGERGTVVPVVDAHQQIAGAHRLVVGNANLGDQAGDLGRDDRHVGADIRIVGALNETADRPPIVGIPSRAGPECHWQ